MFHPAGTGIGHQLMVERGFVHPGSLVVASDSHSNTYGALAAVGTPVVRTDAAAIWATGQTWWQVPRSIRVTLTGKLRAGATGKDVIITLCGLYGTGEVLNAAVEFAGPGVATLSLPERLAIANMSTEWGTLVGWFPFDAVTAAYLRDRAVRLREMGIEGRLDEAMIAGWEANPPGPDPDATYAAEIELDLGLVSPHVAGPDTVFVTKPVQAIARERVRVNKAYLLSCTNGRLDDFAAAAEVLRGRRVADGVELWIAAASAEVQAEAEARGIWKDLLAAGARALPPGCGACIGLGVGLLEKGEVGISATNRNFKGRMGSRDAKAYLASPAVVAASAVAGYITAPAEVGEEAPPYAFRAAAAHAEARSVDVLPGFPARFTGRALLQPVDNLNTDGIYGKDVTYRDDLTPEQMAGYAMANYDPEFQGKAAAGDIIVAGRNFGTGSSREQAATALKYRGIAHGDRGVVLPDLPAQRFQQRVHLPREPGAVRGGAVGGHRARGGGREDDRRRRPGDRRAPLGGVVRRRRVRHRAAGPGRARADHGGRARGADAHEDCGRVMRRPRGQGSGVRGPEDATGTRGVQVFYDGACDLCASTREWAKERDDSGRLQFVNFRDAGVGALPVTRAQLEREMWVRRADGTLCRGFAGTCVVLAELPGWRWPAAVLAAPPLRWLGAIVYWLVARHRARL